jgi:hypothetical protein
MSEELITGRGIDRFRERLHSRGSSEYCRTGDVPDTGNGKSNFQDFWVRICPEHSKLVCTYKKADGRLSHGKAAQKG